MHEEMQKITDMVDALCQQIDAAIEAANHTNETLTKIKERFNV